MESFSKPGLLNWDWTIDVGWFLQNTLQQFHILSHYKHKIEQNCGVTLKKNTKKKILKSEKCVPCRSIKVSKALENCSSSMRLDACMDFDWAILKNNNNNNTFIVCVRLSFFWKMTLWHSQCQIFCISIVIFSLSCFSFIPLTLKVFSFPAEGKNK